MARKLRIEYPGAIYHVMNRKKQGAKLGLNQIARNEDAARARQSWGQATAAGMKGQARVHWVMGKMGRDARTDESRLRRLFRASFFNQRQGK
jgi:hypothetical protein